MTSLKCTSLLVDCDTDICNSSVPSTWTSVTGLASSHRLLACSTWTV